MNGLLFYLVKNAQGEDIIVNEKELSPIISFSQAKDRLFSSQIDRSEHLRYAIKRFGINKLNFNRLYVVYEAIVRV